MAHIRQHTGDLFRCLTCDKGYTTKRFLREHEQTHKGNGYNCDKCGKSYQTPRGLKLHSAVHTGDYKHVCSICSMGFMSKTHLDGHMAKHEGLRPHVCKKCGKAFRHISNKTSHERECGSRDRLHCPVCNKIMPSPGFLEKHLVSHSEQPMVFPCTFCGSWFQSRSQVFNHVKEIHQIIQPWAPGQKDLRAQQDMEYYHNLEGIYDDG